MVGLYLTPAEAAVVFPVDGKPPDPGIARTALPLPLLPTQPNRVQQPYIRAESTLHQTR